MKVKEPYPTISDRRLKQGPYATRYHRDGSITVWDLYASQWVRTDQPSDQLLATLSPDERRRVHRHLLKSF